MGKGSKIEMYFDDYVSISDEKIEEILNLTILSKDWITEGKVFVNDLGQLIVRES